jgi:anti-sigma regulatory factor (Ser/Thr protein kinase)
MRAAHGDVPVLRTTAELANLGRIRRFVEDAATALGADATALRSLLLAVDEASTNIILHGYRGQGGTITIAVARAEENLIIRLTDTAEPFDPTGVLPPDVALPLESRRVGGMGLHLIRQATDAVMHRIPPQGGNELTLIRRLGP